jgi:DNA-binding NarL/FixJ family response regulator
LAQRLARTCGYLIYVLEHAALTECLSDYPSIGPILEPPSTHLQEAVQAALASTAHACPSGLLTRRERDVLALMAHGYSVPAIAQGLQVAVGTIGKHQENIYAKLGVHSPIDAVLTAHRSGVIRYITADD